MANIMIADFDLTESATITAEGTVAPSLPAANLKTPDPREVCRWTSLTGMAIVVDLGSGESVNLIALIGHNFSAAGVWRIRAAQTLPDVTAAPTYDTLFKSVWAAYPGPAGYENEKQTAIDSFSDHNARYWRIDFQDATNPDGYIDIGRVCIARAWQPEVNAAYGESVTWVDPSEVVRARDGYAWSSERTKYRNQKLSFDFGSETDMRGHAYEINRRQGLTRPVLVLTDPDSTTYMHTRVIYGLLKNLNPITNSAYQIYQTAFEIEELPA